MGPISAHFFQRIRDPSCKTQIKTPTGPRQMIFLLIVSCWTGPRYFMKHPHQRAVAKGMNLFTVNYIFGACGIKQFKQHLPFF